MADLDAIRTSHRFLRTIFRARVQQVIRSTIELEQTCPNHRHVPVAPSVVWVVPLEVIITDGSFNFRIVSCSSVDNSLLLII